MKSKRTFLKSFLLFCSFPFFTSAQNNLTVGDPRQSFYTKQGTIEEASLAIRNKGLFVEYGLYLTFSARGSNYGISDSLEIVLNFTLPPNAIVTDSWLWIYEDVCKAEILDIWSATNIYENIVKRRKDPSLLTKTSESNYNLRIFPMGGLEQRKVKITYLLPINWNPEKVNAPLPTYILNTSRYIPKNFPLLIWSDKDFINPTLDKNHSGFVDGKDSFNVIYKTTTIGSTGVYPAVNISYNNPMKNGIYMNYFTGTQESYYQIALQPSTFTTQIEKQKIAFLLDYQQQNNAITKQDFLNQLKLQIKNSLTDQDSFNLFLSSINIFQSSTTWRPASDEQIEIAFLDAANKLASFSNLPSLLGAGLQFINLQQGKGKIMLFSNSDQYGAYQSANEIILLIDQQNIHSIQINILDYCNNSKSYSINGRNYYNNEYLFINLSNISGGYYAFTRNGITFSNALPEIFLQSLPKIKGFDLYLKIQQGITYGKYPLTSKYDNLPVNAFYTQTGLFRGDFPFTVEISGEIDRTLFYTNFNIQESELSKLDSTVKTIWAAQNIQRLEAQSNSNANTQEIIYKSIQNRILSKYTAFLCVEDSSLYCLDCIDETEFPTDSEDEFQDSLANLKIFPNPCREQLTIELHANSFTHQNEWHGEIIDLSGKTIHHFLIQNQFKNGILQYIWNGLTDSGREAAAGAYVLYIHSKDKRIYQKIIKM